jgi:NAD(P)-dependent dehydrogenase (short-subunit alcohol dehydrogenase family)
MTLTALITGANRGIGLETARHLGRQDVHVLVGARDAEAGHAAAAELRAEGLSADAVTLDVAALPSVKAAAARIAADHGRLDILVNNAGILPEATADRAPGSGPLDLDLFRRTFDTNLFGAVAVTQELLPLLVDAPAGRIVNVSSTMGSLREQLNPESPYYALIVPAYQGSKAALNGLTIALAKALAGTGVKVNSVCPGWVQTDLGGPDNRAAAPTTATEAAAVVADLALAGADGPTGTFVDRDGAVAW